MKNMKPVESRTRNPRIPRQSPQGHPHLKDPSEVCGLGAASAQALVDVLDERVESKLSANEKACCSARWSQIDSMPNQG